MCPECGPVDPLRLRRLSKLPGLLSEKDLQIIPPIVKQKVIPILGVLALVVGVWLTVNNRQPTRDIALVSNADTPPFDSNLPVARANSPTPTVESTPPPTIVRFPTGTDLDSPSRVGGRGWLRISNGTTDDAIAKLVDSSTGKTCRRVYIRAGDAFKIARIGSGNYVLKFSLGSDYDKDSGKFLRDPSFSKFDDMLDFTVQRTGSGIEWFNHEVTLNPVLGGTARTSKISADEFDEH